MSTKSLDGVLIKKANQQETYTEQQVEDLVKCMNPDDGYLHFAKNFAYIQHPVKGKLLFEPYEYQERLMYSYHNHRFNINMMPRQTGKALALDTPIPTKTSWTTMGDIQVGDKILGPDGNETTVTFATDVMHNHKCYKVTFDNSETIIADAEHLWNVNSRFWRTGVKTKTTEEIKEYIESKNTCVYIQAAEEIKTQDVELPIDPYVLGLWLGDGESAGARYTQSIIDNKEIINEIINRGFEISKAFPNGASINSENRTIYGLKTKLNKNNLLKNKHIPEIYLRGSVNQRLELLQGLMDTDGSIDKRSGRCEFYQKKYKLVEQVRELLSSLGIKNRCNYKVINGQKYYTIGFATTKYKVFKLSRKAQYQDNCKGHQKNTRHYITDITEVESVPVRCIQVDNDEHLFLCGKSMIPTHNTTCAAIYLAWYAMFHPDQTILIAAHKYTGAQEIMQRIRYVYEMCPDFIRAGVTSYNKGSIEFENGSRIVSQTTTGNTGRGMSISLLYADEFAFVQPNIAEEFWTSISPTLATGGRAILTSTPNSDEDTFATIWKQAEDKFDEHGNEQDVGRNGFHGFRATWDEHPDRDEEWQKAEIGRIGEEKFRREYGCEFLVFDETLISSLKLAVMEGESPLLNMGQTRWYKKPSSKYSYVVALDPSMGTGGDHAAIEVYELPSYEQVAEWQHNTTAIPGQIRVLRDICNYIAEQTKNPQSIYWSVENNGIGEAALIVIQDFGEENIPGLFVSEPIRKGHVRKFRRGFNTTHGSKITACSRLKTMIENDKITIRSKPLVSELKGFIATGSSFEAKVGATDDLVSATLLALRMMTVLKDWDPRVYDTFTQIEQEDDYEQPMPIFISSSI
jgi:hypothetical protein